MTPSLKGDSFSNSPSLDFTCDIWGIFHDATYPKKTYTPGHSKGPFDPLVGGHLTIPKRSQRIARP